MLDTAIRFVAMPTKKPDDIKQTNLRLKVSTVARMRAYANAHPLQPTLTQLVEAAVERFLDDEERHESKPPAKRK